MNERRPLVIYHGPACNDGWCSAWVAHRFFGDKADYLPANYGQEPPDLAWQGGRDILILDFSYPKETLRKLGECNHWVTILDHHRTAQADLTGYEIENSFVQVANAVTAKFDMTKSGARLTWEYFYPGKPSPWLVDYTEDRDLWKWKLPASKEINAALASYPHTFELWDKWAGFGQDAAMAAICQQLADGKSYHNNLIREMVVEGAAILRYQQQQVDNQCKNAVEIEMDGFKVLCVNATMLISEIAGQLAIGRPFGVTWFQRGDGKKIYSLRSRDNGVDVSEIAKRHGGGGHQQAAGFQE